MATYKIFRINAEGAPYAKAAKTLVDPEGGIHTEAHKAVTEKFGDVAYKIFVVQADGSLAEFGGDRADQCVNGHDKAEWWTVTKGGRKYCRKCACEASKRSKSKKAEQIAGDQLEAANLG